MKHFLLILCVVASGAVRSQVVKADLQASGLTCSMCSNAIYKSLLTLDFVEAVKVDINKSAFEITFKTGKQVNLDKIRGKVEKAGFSVSKMLLSINFNNTKADEEGYVIAGNFVLKSPTIKNSILNGLKKVKMIDKGFIAANEYKKNAVTRIMRQYKQVYNVIVEEP